MEKPKRFRQSLSIAGTILRLCPWQSLAMVALAFCTGPLAALAAGYTGVLVDTAVEYMGVGQVWPVFRVLLIVLAFSLANSLAAFLSGVMRNRVDEALSLRITEETLRISGRIDYLHYISKEHRDAQAAYADDALGVYLSLGMFGAISLVQSAISFISYIILLYSTAGVVALVSGILALIAAICISARAQSIYNQFRDNTKTERRRLAYIDSLFKNTASFTEMTLFGFASRLKGIFGEAFETYADKRYRSERKSAAYKLWLNVIHAVIALCAMLSFFAFGKISTAGQMTVVFTAFFSLLETARYIGSNTSMAKSLFERVKLFNEYRAEYELPPTDSEAPPRVPGAPAVELSGVGFSYDENRKILEDITFSIRPGQTLAIVGENGAGKTTLSNIILGLFPCEGSVRTFGRDPYEMRRYGIVDSVAVLQQFGQYRALSLGENIAFGDAPDPVKLERIDDFFAGKDYDVMTGEPFGGVSYSGGEWQKIALARCASSAADILILDEPTAALDPMAEASVFRRFMEVNRGKTCILITHRLGAVRTADLILVLKDRRIHEHGTHEELMRRGGYYADMFSAQAQWYAKEGTE